MSENYRGYELNEPGEAADWSTRENTLFKALIDTIPEEGETLVTSEHVHAKLVSPDKTIDPVVLTDDDGRFIVGQGLVSADTLLHVWIASAGAVTAPADAAATIESDDDVALSLLVPDAKTSRIVFGTPTDNDRYSLEADKSDDLCTMKIDGDNFFVADKAGAVTGAADSAALCAAGTLMAYVTSTALYIATGKTLRCQSGDLRMVNGSNDGFAVDDTSGDLKLDNGNYYRFGHAANYGNSSMDMNGTLPVKDNAGNTVYLLFSNSAATSV